MNSPNDSSPQSETRGLGKGMYIMAWLVALILLSLLFDDQLMQQFNPNQDPQSRVLGNQTEVVLKRNRQGHYVTSGTINGQPVVFLLDTGATDVSIPANLAPALGLRKGRPMRVITANGTVTVHDTVIEQLAIGDISLYQIDGNINPGMGSDKILLGMSVLKQLEFTQRGDTLTLRTL